LTKCTYGQAIREAFAYLLQKYPEVFIFGQGLWSPWYVGNSMTNLEKQFGKDRVIDSPISELACTGAAIGAALNGLRPIVIHPRMDFMLLAADQIVNQAAKWRSMLGGAISPALTIRGIINRGGEQGAQHSQALHSWFAHIPGLRVVMPSSVQDARNLMISSVLCDDPVLYIDDKWLYEREEVLPPIVEQPLGKVVPLCIRNGSDVTIVSAGYSTYLSEKAAELLALAGVSCEVIDLRQINPLDTKAIESSVTKTGNLVVIDGGWKNCGLAGEIIARVCEHPDVFSCLKESPLRITLPDSPAPTSKPLENAYYVTVDEIVKSISVWLGCYNYAC
jgi:acetoin:2,6-dichlorophenolindophenol oxidoreductase subunit beta